MIEAERLESLEVSLEHHQVHQFNMWELQQKLEGHTQKRFDLHSDWLTNLSVGGIETLKLNFLMFLLNMLFTVLVLNEVRFGLGWL